MLLHRVEVTVAANPYQVKVNAAKEAVEEVAKDNSESGANRVFDLEEIIRRARYEVDRLQGYRP